MIKFTVKGIVPSKANLYRVGRGGFYRDPKVVQFEYDFAMQTKRVKKDTFGECALEVHYVMYLKNMRQDADNIEKMINDCMEKCRIIPNDKLIIMHKTLKLQDKKNPRIEIVIKEWGEDE